ncbi:MAG TPA: SAM-dependent methyltransferase [Candidatus Nanoarchaeia archaeon]|nr:SAM-dependent methyltransferase [Candidatus Nanoarchaeia archaeon]
MMFIVEHLEPDMFEWCVLEYKHIAQMVGKDNVMFTNVKKHAERLQGLKVVRESVADLKLQNALVLDPAAKDVLSSKDKPAYVILGGILGDHPPKARTGKELSSRLPFPTRHMGKKQFSTDNAVFVARELLLGKQLKDIPLQDEIEIVLNDVESVILPFTYVLINGEPLIPPGLKEYLLERDEF